MLTQSEYLLAWFFYLFGAGLFIFALWQFSRHMKKSEPKHLVRILVPVFLLVPWYSGTTGSYLSPAWIVSLVEGIFEGPDAFWRAGTPLMAALVLSLIIASITYLCMWFWQRFGPRST